MSTVEQTRQEILQKCDQAERMLDTVRDRAPEAARLSVESTPGLNLLPAAVKSQMAAEISAQVIDNAEYARTIAEQFRGVTGDFGDSAVLRENAEQLRVQVAQQVGDLRAAMDNQMDGLQAIKSQNWDSHGRGNYAAAFDSQKDELDALDAACRELEQSLTWAADSIDSWIGVILNAVLSLLLAIAALLAGLLGGLNPASIVSAALSFLSSVVPILGSLLEHYNDQAAGSLDRQAALADATGDLTWQPTPFGA